MTYDLLYTHLVTDNTSVKHTQVVADTYADALVTAKKSAKTNLWWIISITPANFELN